MNAKTTSLRPLFMVLFLLSLNNLFSQLTQQWVKQYDYTNGVLNPNSGWTSVLDRYGNIYAAGTGKVGTSYGEFEYGETSVVKYDTTGHMLWANYYNGTGNGFSHPDRILIDTSGNVYVGGTCDNLITGNDFFVLKYDMVGNLVWSRTYSSPGLHHEVFGDMLIEANCLYLTGSIRTATDQYRSAFLKYDLTGNLLSSDIQAFDCWGTDARYASSGSQYLQKITADKAGGIYVGTNRLMGGNSRITLLKYDTAGYLKWDKQIIDSVNLTSGYLMQLLADTAGGVYIKSKMNYAITSGPDPRFACLIKCDTAGNVVWSRRIAGTDPSGINRPGKIVIDRLNNIYSSDVLDNTSADQMSLKKYDENGNLLWSASGLGNMVSDLMIDTSGNLIATGTTNYAGSGDGFIRKYNKTTGVLLYNKTQPFTSYSPGKFVDIDVDIEGYAYAFGQNFSLRKYSPTGNQVWVADTLPRSRQSWDTANVMVTDRLGNIYVGVETINGAGRQQGTVVKYDINGNKEWERDLYDTVSTTSPCTLNSILVDSLGNVYIAVQMNSPPNLNPTYYTLLVQLDDQGNIIKRKGCRGLYIKNMQFNKSGNIVTLFDSVLYANIQFIRKYTSDFTLLSTKTIPSSFSLANATNTLLINEDNEIYITSLTSSTTPRINKCDSTGSFLWQYIGPTVYNTAMPFVLDRESNLYYMRENGFMDKINSNGSIVWSRYFSGIWSSMGSQLGAMMIDSTHIYYAGIKSQGVQVLLKSDTAGNLIWKKTYDLLSNWWSSDEIVALNVDHQGRIYAGGTMGINSNVRTDYYLTVYDSSGNPLDTIINSGSRDNGLKKIIYQDNALIVLGWTDQLTWDRDVLIYRYCMAPAPMLAFDQYASGVCRNSAIAYSVPYQGNVWYNWSYSGNGVSVNDNGNSAVLNFSSNSTNGVLSVTGSYCGATTAPLTVHIQVDSILPVVNAGSDNTLCAGTQYVLTGTGDAINYTWNNGVIDGVSIFPVVSADYIVTGVDSSGCSNTDTVTIAINPLPPVEANASTDTVCTGSNVTLTGSGATSISWNNGVTDGMPFIPVNTDDYIVTGIGTNGCLGSDTIRIIVSQCIYPGDANSDGIADNNDLIELGLRYGASGGARSSINNVWQPLDAPVWGTDTVSTGYNLNHADCNGDGTISLDDTLAVNLNYGLTHTLRLANNTLVNTSGDIYFGSAQTVYGSNQQVSMDVYLGENTNPLLDFYGAAFTIGYSDNTLIQTGSLSFSIDNTSWVGTINANAIRLATTDEPVQKLYGAVSRIDHTNTTGSGKIGTIRFITGNVSGIFSVSASDAYAVDNSGTHTPLTAASYSVTVTPGVSLQENGNISGIVVYPNPNHGNFVIGNLDPKENYQLTIKDVLGRTIYARKLWNTVTSEVVLDKSAGIYWLELKSDKDSFVQKIVIE